MAYDSQGLLRAEVDRRRRADCIFLRFPGDIYTVFPVPMGYDPYELGGRKVYETDLPASCLLCQVAREGRRQEVEEGTEQEAAGWDPP